MDEQPPSAETVQVYFDLADDLPLPIPGRIAYGMVVDLDGDGVAYVRFGMDNISTRNIEPGVRSRHRGDG